MTAALFFCSNTRIYASITKEVNKVKIEIVGKPKEIAALVLAVQERQSQVVNQLVLDPVYNTSRMQNNTSQINTLAGDSSEDIK